MFLVVCLAIVLSVVDCAPFNAEGPFYNGDAASAPSFDIKVGFVCKKEIMKTESIYRSICGLDSLSRASASAESNLPRSELYNLLNLVLIKRLAKSKEEYYDFIYAIGLKSFVGRRSRYDLIFNARTPRLPILLGLQIKDHPRWTLPPSLLSSLHLL